MEHLLHNPDLMPFFSAFGAMVVVVLIWSALIEKDPLPERMRSVTDRRAQLRDAERSKKLSRHSLITRAGVIKQVIESLKLAQGKKLDELRVKLARAGYRSRDTLFTFFLSKLIAPPALAFLGFLFIFVLHATHVKPAMGILVVLALFVFGYFLPNIYLKNATQKREDVLRKAMPDALDLLVICAEAGLSLDAALERVSREMGSSCPELSEEIGLTAVELSFYPERSKALQNLSDRVALPGVMALVNTLIQTERYGTPLAQALRVLSAEMREERMMAAETKAAKLPATLTVPMMLFIMPPLFVVLLGPALIKVSAMMK